MRNSLAPITSVALLAVGGWMMVSLSRPVADVGAGLVGMACAIALVLLVETVRDKPGEK